jgi:perosamine synthetase
VLEQVKALQLALHGGPPVRKHVLPYGHQSIEEDDIRAVVDVLRSDWITTGPEITRFEEELALCVGARYAIALSSGTAALHAACFAAGLSPGDEAITTPLTFCATANCVIYQGAVPIFVDVCPDTLNLDPRAVEGRITQRTKAIVAVDYAGNPADLDQLRKLATNHDLVFIEDACHALGAEYKNRRVGSIADMTVFSFHPVKHITTGEGGMVTTNDAALARRLKIFRNHGIDSDVRERQASGQWRYDMVELGYNYRLTDIACALGRSQLQRLKSNLERRRQIAARYTVAFQNFPGVVSPTIGPDDKPAWHLYPIKLDLSRFTVSRDEILKALRAENIGVNVHYMPVYLHSFYQQYLALAPGHCPIAESAYARLISLPMFHGMGDSDIEDTIAAMQKVCTAYSA